MDVALGQRSRAALQFLGSAQGYAGGTLQPAAAAVYEQAVPEPPLDLDSRRASVESVLADCAEWQMDRLVTRWVAEEIYVRALPAVEEIRPRVEKWLEVGESPVSLELNPDREAPAYWEGGFHLTPGGWDGHDLMGTAIHELVFAYVLTPGGVGAVRTGQNLNDQRAKAAREAYRDEYRNIAELGSSTGRFTVRLHQAYPQARITGVELGASALRHGRAYLTEQGVPARLVQAAAEDTGLPDASFDLVAMYTLIHEVPVTASAQIFAEAFRLLEPGGDLLIGEIAPTDQHSAFRAVVLDWETENRGEPYAREAMSMDAVAMLREAGFTEIESYGLDGVHPWVTRARKPQA
ncbi:class I SAM-dependent methyltransferase [Kineosporia babensis]|uniref:Methyltransferase domain-containing protein n=1 Tax=Kineosporia babensis TaxID=499548 RepID=A0A9X1NIR3_9ACTN|nr:class I SAM-dependent methyltransferase [Kineosporia babensis]MCD5313971.1 methyltransferase domain-containing protein [Kineosporia babensis]